MVLELTENAMNPDKETLWLFDFVYSAYSWTFFFERTPNFITILSISESNNLHTIKREVLLFNS